MIEILIGRPSVVASYCKSADHVVAHIVRNAGGVVTRHLRRTRWATGRAIGVTLPGAYWQR